MLIFLAVCLSITLWRIGFAKRDEIFEDCLSKDKTNSIRGAFIILVFFSHFTSYIQNFNILDQYEKTLLALISQRMVTMFLLYSGYGIMESIKKKGKSYVNGIPLKRIGKVLLQFDIAVFLFILVKCIIGQASSLSVKLVLLSLIGWKSVGNSNWYVFAVIIAYFAAFIGFKPCRRDRRNHRTDPDLLLSDAFPDLSGSSLVRHDPMFPAWHGAFRMQR